MIPAGLVLAGLRASATRRAPAGGGASPVVQGFSDTSVNVRLKWKALDRLRPYASWTHTTFKLGASPSNGYEGGVRLRLYRVSLRAAYQRYAQKGWADRDHFTLGASHEF